MFGTYVIDDKFRFPITRICMQENKIFLEADVRGPIQALPYQDYQIIVLGADLTEIFKTRVTVGWNERGEGEFFTIAQPINLEDSKVVWQPMHFV